MADEQLCTGKLPARTDAIKFKLSDFLSGTRVLRMAGLAAEFGHEEQTPPISWGMYANDRFGVCVIAGGCHESVLFAREGGEVIGFNDRDLLNDFTAITGQAPSPTVGADMQQAASYRRRIGLLDASRKRRKIAAYLEIQPGNINEIYYAIQNFGGAGIGIQCPANLFDQFRRHQSWHIVPGVGMLGSGHYIPAFASRGGNLVTVSWARFQAMRPSYCVEYMDEGIVYVSFDILKAGRSPEGFDAQGLLKRLTALGTPQ